MNTHRKSLPPPPTTPSKIKNASSAPNGNTLSPYMSEVLKQYLNTNLFYTQVVTLTHFGQYCAKTIGKMYK